MLKNILEVWEIILKEASKVKLKRLTSPGIHEIDGSSSKSSKNITSKEENDIGNYKDIAKLKKSYEKLMKKIVNPRLDILTPSINICENFKGTQNLHKKEIMNSTMVNIMFDRQSCRLVTTLPAAINHLSPTDRILGWSGQTLDSQSFNPRPEMSMKPNSIASAFFIFPELLDASKKETLRCSNRIRNKIKKKRHSKFRINHHTKSKQLVKDIPKSRLCKFNKFHPTLLKIDKEIENTHNKKYKFFSPPKIIVEDKSKAMLNDNASNLTKRINDLECNINSEVNLSKSTDEDSCHKHIQKDNTNMQNSNKLLNVTKSDSKNIALPIIKAEPDNVTCATPQLDKNKNSIIHQNSQVVPKVSLLHTHMDIAAHNQSDNKSTDKTNSMSNNLIAIPVFQDFTIAQSVESKLLEGKPTQVMNTLLKENPITQSHTSKNTSIQDQEGNCITSKNKSVAQGQTLTKITSILNEPIVSEKKLKKQVKYEHLNQQVSQYTDSNNKGMETVHNIDKLTSNKEFYLESNIQSKKIKSGLGKVIFDNPEGMIKTHNLQHTKRNTNNKGIKSPTIYPSIRLNVLNTMKESYDKHTLNKDKEIPLNPNTITNIKGQLVKRKSTEQINNNKITNILSPLGNAMSLDNNTISEYHNIECKKESEKIDNNSYVGLSENKSNNFSFHHLNEDSQSKTVLIGNDIVINKQNKNPNRLTLKSLPSTKTNTSDIIQPKSSMTNSKKTNKKSVTKSEKFKTIKFVKNKEWYFNPYLNKLPHHKPYNSTLPLNYSKYKTVDICSQCKEDIENNIQSNDTGNKLCDRNKNNKTQKSELNNIATCSYLKNGKNYIHCSNGNQKKALPSSKTNMGHDNLNIRSQNENLDDSKKVYTCPNIGNHSLRQNSKAVNESKQLDLSINNQNKAPQNKTEQNYFTKSNCEHVLGNISLKTNSDLKLIKEKYSGRGTLRKLEETSILKKKTECKKGLLKNNPIEYNSKINDMSIVGSKSCNIDKCVYSGKRRKLHTKKTGSKVFNLKMYGSPKNEALSDVIVRKVVLKTLEVEKYKKIDKVQSCSLPIANSCFPSNKHHAVSINNILIRDKIQQSRNLSINHRVNRMMSYISRRYVMTMTNSNSKYSRKFRGLKKSCKLGTSDNYNSTELQKSIKAKEIKYVNNTIINKEGNKHKLNTNDNEMTASKSQMHNSATVKSTTIKSNDEHVEIAVDGKMQPVRSMKPSTISNCPGTRKTNLVTNNKDSEGLRIENNHNISKQFLLQTDLINKGKSYVENPEMSNVYTNNKNKQLSDHSHNITKCNEILIKHPKKNSHSKSIKNEENIPNQKNMYNQIKKPFFPGLSGRFFNKYKFITEGKMKPIKTKNLHTIEEGDINIINYNKKQMYPIAHTEYSQLQEKWKSKTDRLKDWTLLKKKNEHRSHKRTLIKSNSNQRNSAVITPPSNNSNQLVNEIFNGNTNSVQQTKNVHLPFPKTNEKYTINTNKKSNGKENSKANQNVLLHVNSSPQNLTKNKVNSFNEIGVSCNNYNETKQNNQITNNHEEQLHNKKHEMNVKNSEEEKKLVMEIANTADKYAHTKTLNKQNFQQTDCIVNSLTQTNNNNNRSLKDNIVKSRTNISKKNLSFPITKSINMLNDNNPIGAILNTPHIFENTSNNHQLSNPKINRTAIRVNSKAITKKLLMAHKDPSGSAVQMQSTTDCNKLDKKLGIMSNRHKDKIQYMETLPTNQIKQNSKMNSSPDNMLINIEQQPKSVVFPLKSDLKFNSKEISRSNDTTINLKEENVNKDSDFKAIKSVLGLQKNIPLDITGVKSNKKITSKTKSSKFGILNTNQTDIGFSTRMINNVFNQSDRKINKVVVPIFNRNKYHQSSPATGKTFSNNLRENTFNDLFRVKSCDTNKTINKSKTSKRLQLQNINTIKSKILNDKSTPKNNSTHTKNESQSCSGDNDKYLLNTNVGDVIKMSNNSLHKEFGKSVKLTKEHHGITLQDLKTKKDLTPQIKQEKQKLNEFKEYIDIPSNGKTISKLPSHEMKQLDNKLKSTPSTQTIAIKEKKSCNSSLIPDNFLNSYSLNDDVTPLIHPIEKEVHAIKIPLRTELPYKNNKIFKTVFHKSN